MSMDPVAWASPNGRLNNIVSHNRNGTFTVPLVRLSDAEERIRELTERLSPDPQGGDWIDALESSAENLRFQLAAAEARAEAAEALLKEAREALEPFALILTEGIAKRNEVYTSVTTCTDYFRAARAIHDKIGVKDE